MLNSALCLEVRSIPQVEENDLDKDVALAVRELEVLQLSRILEDGDGDETQDLLSDSFLDCRELLF